MAEAVKSRWLHRRLSFPVETGFHSNSYHIISEPKKYITVNIGDSEENTSHQRKLDWTGALEGKSIHYSARIMPRIWTTTNRWRTRILLICVLGLGVYILLVDPGQNVSVPDNVIDIEVIQEELDIGIPVKVVSYKSPLDEKLYVRQNHPMDDEDESGSANVSTVLKYHRIWQWADEAITPSQLFPDDPAVDKVLAALANAAIVNVDILDIGDYESGTSEKWVATLEGGQKAMMKLLWETKGAMKKGGLCNYGFEIPTAEIAAFHLHRVMGFRNTPYVTGRKVNIRHEVMPVASPHIIKQIQTKPGNHTCVTAKCSFCRSAQQMCSVDGVMEVSMAWWVPRKLKLHTYPPEYMPFSTPSMDEWKKFGFNNKKYCDKVHKTTPYDEDHFYHDLFDFAVLDTLMYHYDTKHYTLNDHSDANGLTIRLDHGRAFCAFDRDEEHVFLAPVTQCCTLRRTSWERVNALRGGELSKRLRAALAQDPIAPVLAEVWFPVLERRLAIITDMMEKCSQANGGWHNVLVT